MKISELIKELEKTRLQYGDLNIILEVWYTEYCGQERGSDAFMTGDLDRLYVEERTNLCLLTEQAE